MTEAERLKNEGNALLNTRDFEGAVAKYTQAIELDGNNHIFYSNRSAAWAKLGDFSQALADANRCVDISPNWGKGYARLATAYDGLDYVDKAEKARTRAKELGVTPAMGARDAGGQSQGSKTWLLGARMLTVASFSIFLISFATSYFAYRMTLLCAFISYVLHIISTYGTPTRSQEYLKKLASEYRVQYALVVLLMGFLGYPSLQVLIPHFLSEVGFVAEYILQNQPGIASRVSPFLENYVLPAFTKVADANRWKSLSLQQKWTHFNNASRQTCALVEVATGFMFLIGAFRGQLLVFIAYVYYLTMRYNLSRSVRRIFSDLDAYISRALLRFPSALNVYQKSRDMVHRRVAVGGPPLQQ